MSFQVDDVSTYDERRVTVAITGGPLLPKSYSKRSYRVTEVRLTYRRRDGAVWEVGTPVLSGPWVKKDGTDGVDTTSDTCWGSQGWPEWLSDMVTDYMPGVDR